jgi:P pilus assembly chaperone PapD
MLTMLRAFLATLMLLAASAHASVIIVGTRVIYPAGSRDVSIRLLNRGDRPALIQAWIDRGDPNSKPDNVSVPFSLSPTLARIDPEKGQVLRLVYTGEALPQDKESVFWLNMLEIPPKPANAENVNYLQFAVRTRIKIFYRPKQIKGDTAEAIKSLQWRLLRDGEAWVVEGRNSSPYFISLTAIEVKADAKADDSLATAPGSMIAPGETGRFELKIAKPGIAAAAPLLLRYAAVNDYGAVIETDAPLAAPDAVKPPLRN